MEHFIDELASQLSAGLSRRVAVLRLMKGFGGALVASLGLPPYAFGAGCFAACEKKCTDSKGVLNFKCFRDCVNSDPNNCGSCGNKCPQGTNCVNGKCVGTSCDTDLPTLASLQTAMADLQAGGTDVALTPQGCTRYRRTFVSGKITSEELVFNGTAIVIFAHTSTASTKQEDADKDGFFEYQSVQPVSPSPGQPILQSTKYSSTSRLPLEQTSWFNESGTIRVTFAEADSSGTLTTRASYIQGPLNTLLAPFLGPGPLVKSAQTSCIDCSPSGLADAFGQAMVDGFNCLWAGGNQALAQRLLSDFVRVLPGISCGTPEGDSDSNPLGAQTQSYPGTSLSPNPTVTIVLNAARLCAQPGLVGEAGILFHEIFHLDYLTHIPEQEKSKQFVARVDQAYACTGYCFAPHGKVTQCACARCLDTSTCDPRCSTTLGFVECNDFGFWCPCPANPVWFETCSACTENCPSSLACFGFEVCIPDTTNSCGPPPACPS
jgi:hypothetical protein